MFHDTLSSIWKAIFRPEIRLKANFPWSFKKMAGTYAIATGIYFAGSLAPAAAFLLFLQVMQRSNPDLLMRIIWDSAHDRPNMLLLGGLAITSFVMGFSCQVLYIRRLFHKDGVSMRQAMGLNLDSLGGSWWSAAWRVLVSFAVVLGLQQLLSLLPLPAPHDPAAEFASQLRGIGLIGYALLASLGAPLFEEFVFRGFLFNVCRTSFRRGSVFKLLRTEKMADWAAIVVSSAVFAGAHLTLSGFPYLFIIGVVLAALYRRSGSLLCSMMLHALNNTVCMIILIMQIVGH